MTSTTSKIRPSVDLCWGSLLGASVHELATLAASNGFAGITVKYPQLDPSRADKTDIVGLRRRLDDLGLRVSVIDPLIQILPGAPAPDGVAPAFREYFEITADQCLWAAEALRAGIINVVHFLGKPMPIPPLVEAIGKFADRAERCGFRVSIEFIPGTGIPNLATAVQIVTALNARNVGIMLDLWHFARTGGDLEQLRALPPATIISAQLCDRAESPPGQPEPPMTGRMLPGDGVLPLSGIIDYLLNADPSMPLGIEVFSESLRARPHEVAARMIASATQRTFSNRRSET